MTPRGGPLSENGRVIVLCLLFFPIGWVFLPVILLVMAIDGIRNIFWDWRYRRAEKREAAITGERKP